jgi:hypothetical protein
MATDPAVERMRTLLEAAAAELEARREDVLSTQLIWPSALDSRRCEAFLRAVDRELAVLDPAGYVTVPRAGRFPLLAKSGIGVEVDVQRVAQVGSLAGDVAG